MSNIRRAHPFGGIYASTICPMTDNGSIDETALGTHFDALISTGGLNGLLVNGHAGENATLEVDELLAVVKVARAVAGSTRVVAGVNAENAFLAARLATDAADAGADAIMIFPPFSWALGADPRVIEQHHRIVAEASGLPIFLFQGAVNAGHTAFSEAVLSRLLEINSVVGIKEGSWETGAYERTLRLTQRLRPDVGVMASGDEHLFACFVLGSAGSLVSLATVVPELIVALDRAVLDGDLGKAKSVHDRLYDLARVIYASPGHMAPLRLKTCLFLLGRISRVTCRMPIEKLSKEEVSMIRSALLSAELL